MAKLSGTDAAGFDAQLKTTRLYVDPKEASAFAASDALAAATDRVRRFSFNHGLFGQAARSVDDVGIALPNHRTLGSATNVTLRFDPSYMAMAANGAL
jgi:NitT/TauT family transport system substrate-binding protein